MAIFPLRVLVLALLLGGPQEGLAASASTAPTTGLESGARHSFGPDSEGRKDKRFMTGAPMDAYGNPVVPQETEDVVRVRPRPGAYGARTAPPPSRPLPDLPPADSGWKFK